MTDLPDTDCHEFDSDNKSIKLCLLAKAQVPAFIVYWSKKLFLKQKAKNHV